MRNSFAKPETTPQWLLGSVCWTVACVGGWLLLGKWVLDVPYNEKTPDEPLLFVGFVVASGLLWWKAIPGLAATKTTNSWLEILAFCWLCCLVLFQLIWLGLIWLLLLAPYLYNSENFNN